jgi:hypothetical protein
MGGCGTCGKGRVKLRAKIEEEKRKKVLPESKQTTTSVPAPEPKKLSRAERIEARRKRIEARSARVVKRNAMIIARQGKN